ncbi:MAG: DUF763 domain-containing protein [Candidatus Nanohaloarchaeota archaeon]|nr:DUF763 domain-containing protein [Candidatus Nanohaloarchaeota archaeon]
MVVSRSGVAELRLCEGYVPQYKEMVKLAHPFLKLIVEEYGTKEAVKRFSDPYWFQSFATALGFEHNYTGATTVTIRAVKESLQNNDDIGLEVVGGKGIEAIKVYDHFKERGLDEFASISREIAKADNVLMQDSYDLYFHAFIIDKDNFHYTVINQGMNVKNQLVRRYHWYDPGSYDGDSFSTPVSTKQLNLKVQTELQKVSVDIMHDWPAEKITKKILLLRKNYEQFKKGQLTLLSKEELKFFKEIKVMPFYLYFPKKLDVKALEVANQASNYRELFLSPGMGKSALRGLAYLSALIYGKEIQWNDPQQYCYAFGTKAGKPWYVERKAMREAASVLREIAEGLDVEFKKKKEVLKRLSRLI